MELPPPPGIDRDLIHAVEVDDENVRVFEVHFLKPVDHTLLTTIGQIEGVESCSVARYTVSVSQGAAFDRAAIVRKIAAAVVASG